MCERFSQQSGQLGSAGEKHPSSQEVSTHTLRERLKHAIGALASRVTESKTMPLFMQDYVRRAVQKLENYKHTIESRNINVIGPVADQVAYGLPNSSSDLLVSIPLAYPTTPELLEDQRALIEEAKEPGYYDRIDRMFVSNVNSAQSNSDEQRVAN